jgi:hypothetical protein
MKLNQFLSEKKWSIISGVVLLVLFLIITGGLFYKLDRKFDSLIHHVNHLSSGISSLEASISNMDIVGMGQNVDETYQKPVINTENQSLDSELKPKLEDILRYITELNQRVEALKAIIDEGNMPTQFAAETTIAETEDTVAETASKAITDTLAEAKTEAAENNTASHTIAPQTPDILKEKSHNTNSIKAGNDFTVTVKANEVSNLYGYQFNLKYDHDKAAYKGSLESSISEIGMIFKKDKSDHLLVGATMIGDTPGYSGQDVIMCTMVFTANEDLDPSTFTISGVSTVDADQNYVEDIYGWTIDITEPERAPDPSL